MLRCTSVILVLVWDFFVFIVFHYVTGLHPNSRIPPIHGYLHPYANWCFFLVVLLCPAMGWLADTRCGRYRVIRYGMWLMWASSVLLSLLAIAHYMLSQDIQWLSVFYVPLFLLLSVGLNLSQVNIIQFGVDQLTDASSVDISSYINWYVWTFFASELVVKATQNCTVGEFRPVSSLLLPVCLSLALLSDLLFGRYFVVEPISHNPFSLLRGVLAYALKNKYPRQRSAFTYWGDQRYSRIDLAKQKYGGPFTVEQVEDVKTFFRILALVCVMASFVGAGYIYTDLYRVGFRFNHTSTGVGFHFNHTVTDSERCFVDLTLQTLGSVFAVLVIPVYQLVVQPFCPGRPVCFTSRNKFKAGIACVLMTLVTQLILTLTRTRHESMWYGAAGPGNSTTCNLFRDEPPAQIPYYLMPIPKLFECFAKIWLLGSMMEFVCAQSPYSMKSLLFGMGYALSSVFALMSFLAFIPFHYNFPSVHWKGGQKGCEVWFFVTYIGLYLVLLTCFLLMSCSYKKRVRSEDLPSEHLFAENYYDRSIQASMNDASA